MKENEIGDIVVDGAVKVPMRLGPGLFEMVYEAVLSHELQNGGLSIQKQYPAFFSVPPCLRVSV